MKINAVSYLNINQPSSRPGVAVSKEKISAEQTAKHTFPDPIVFDLDGNGKVEILDFIPESLNIKTSKVNEPKQKVLSEYVEVENSFSGYQSGLIANESQLDLEG